MPALVGAFAVIVKVSVPVVIAVIVNVQYSGVPAKVVYGNVIAVPPALVLQLTALTVPVVPIALITDPVGINSSTVALVPEDTPVFAFVTEIV